MRWIRAARSISGVLAVLTLLGLFIAEFFAAGELKPARIQILLLLIGALLGLDLLFENLPVDITIGDYDSEDLPKDEDREPKN